MRLLLAKILILFAFASQAQGFRSRYYLPNAFNNTSRAIFETSPGNYFAAGFVQDTLYGYYIERLTIMGLDGSGQPQWVKKYGNHKIQYLMNGFIRRSFYKQGNFIYHACCVLDSNNKYTGALIKFNQNGDTIWQKIYRDSAQQVIPQMVTGSVDGGFLITGFFQVGGTLTMLIKTDANGNELWRKKLHKVAPNVSDGKAILQDSASGKIVIAGYKYLNGNSIYDNILTLDSLGNILTSKNYSPYGALVYDMIQTSDKKIVIVGIEYDPKTIGGSNLMRSYAIKLDLNALSSPGWQAPVWKVTFDKLSLTNLFACIKELKNKDVLIGGAVDTLEGQNIPNTSIRITKLDTNGKVTFNRYYNYNNTHDTIYSKYARFSSLELTSDGAWLAAIEMISSPNPNPFLFVKYDSTGCDSTLAYCKVMAEVGVEERKNDGLHIKIYPNPAKNLLIISSVSETKLDQATFHIYDVSGRHLKTETLINNAVDVSVLENGMYLLQVNFKNGQAYKSKFIKE